MDSTDVYRTQGSPENLKIRVEIRKVNPSRKFVRDSHGESLEMQEMDRKWETSEKYHFHWQEKVFSKSEAEFYRQKLNCVGYLQNKYHTIVVDPKYEVEKKTRRLFSLVHTDLADDCQELKEQVTTTKNEKPNFLIQNALRRRKEGKIKHGLLKPEITDVGIVLSASEPQDRIADSPSTHLMAIMADIQPEQDLLSSPEEVMLCKLKLTTDGVLSVCPTFNTWKEAYTLYNSKMEMFEYTISHSSNLMTKEEAKKQRNLISSVLGENSTTMEKQVGLLFDVPQEDLLKLYIFGEIATAEGFGPSNIHTCYSIHCPNGWNCEDISWLSGISQKCKPKVDGLEDTAYFSFPFEGQLSYPYQKTSHGPDGLVVKWPLLFVEVWSTDFWNCVRSEGYGYATIPSIPGCHTLKISTWKPGPLSIRSKLEEYFFGGVADIDDLTLVAVPNTHEGHQLSKLGFQTDAGGIVTVRINIVQQAECFLHQVSKKHTLLDKLELSASENSVDAIMAAFHRARQRMLAARASLM